MIVRRLWLHFVLFFPTTLFRAERACRRGFLISGLLGSARLRSQTRCRCFSVLLLYSKTAQACTRRCCCLFRLYFQSLPVEFANTRLFTFFFSAGFSRSSRWSTMSMICGDSGAGLCSDHGNCTAFGCVCHAGWTVCPEFSLRFCCCWVGCLLLLLSLLCFVFVVRV